MKKSISVIGEAFDFDTILLIFVVAAYYNVHLLSIP